MTVDDRKRRVLEAIVALYGMDGEPVGSSLLSEYLDMAVSSATLRNEMAALTKLGLLAQPHTSAGRVPSPQGYRYYVDHLLQDIPALDAESRRMVDSLFYNMDIEPEKLAQSAARALADVTGVAAAATTPRADDLCIAHFEVVQVGRYSAAVLAVTSAGGVRTRVARVDTGLSRQEAAAMAQLLNAHLSFVSPADLSDAMLIGLARQCSPQLTPVLGAAAALIRTEPVAQLEGAQNLVKWPESRHNLATLLEIFADSANASHLIAPDGGKLTVQLGDEMEPTMPGISILSKRYLAGGGLTGTVALIGPSRMNFRKLIPIMDYFSTKLGQCMSGKNQEALE